MIKSLEKSYSNHEDFILREHESSQIYLNYLHDLIYEIINEKIDSIEDKSQFFENLNYIIKLLCKSINYRQLVSDIFSDECDNDSGHLYRIKFMIGYRKMFDLIFKFNKNVKKLQVAEKAQKADRLAKEKERLLQNAKNRTRSSFFLEKVSSDINGKKRFNKSCYII